MNAGNSSSSLSSNASALSQRRNISFFFYPSHEIGKVYQIAKAVAAALIEPSQTSIPWFSWRLWNMQGNAKPTLQAEASASTPALIELMHFWKDGEESISSKRPRACGLENSRVHHTVSYHCTVGIYTHHWLISSNILLVHPGFAVRHISCKQSLIAVKFWWGIWKGCSQDFTPLL